MAHRASAVASACRTTQVGAAEAGRGGRLSNPRTQHAMVMTSQGAPPDVEERPVGSPRDGEVLVKVHASSLNFHDSVNLAGLIWGPWPRVPMTDGAGEVVAVGPGVTEFAV